MVLADNEMYEARTLILCMGVMSAKQLDREDELLGKGSATVPPVMACFTRIRG